MKKLIIKWTTILLSFLAGFLFMDYATKMGNRDMTGTMAEASLPVAYVEKDGRLYNEMHGYVEAMDGSYMKDSIIGLSQDHRLGLAIEKFNADITSLSYEVRPLDMSRLIEDGKNLDGEDDGRYVHLEIRLKDLLKTGEPYLFLLDVEADGREVTFYSLLSYLGENHVEECLAFAEEFHEMAIQKQTDHTYLQYLEPNSTMDGSSLGYVNIHSRSGPITWGDMPVKQTTESKLTFTGFDGDVTALVMEYQVKDAQTKEVYQVSESFRVRYTSSRMYLLAYERMADQVFTVGRQIVTEDGQIAFGIQSREPEYKKNDEENVIGFVRQGQLWCYDFGQNRLSLVYGFEDGKDMRGNYGAHDFRLLEVDDSGGMDFLVYGYMNRGLYEGRCGILLCRYDALLNTVEERFFLPSDRPYAILQEEIGSLAAVNDEDLAWISYRGDILQVDLTDYKVETLAEGIGKNQLRVSEDVGLAAWTDKATGSISLLNIENGIINEITSESGELLEALGFMEKDFIYGAARQEDVRTSQGGEPLVPLYRIVIRDHAGNEVREFNYMSKGKYVTGVSIVENRIDLSCVTLAEDGSFQKALPEPITYTSEKIEEKLRFQTISDEVKRNEYWLVYGGTIKKGNMKQPKVKQVLYEGSRILDMEASGLDYYFTYSFDGKVSSHETLSEAVRSAYDEMGTVWKGGSRCFWERGGRQSRAQLQGFENMDGMEEGISGTVQCLQLMLRQKQIYTEVESSMEAGMPLWEICERELGESCCLLPGCSLDMVLYYVSGSAPVLAFKDTGEAVLIVGYDAQNVIYYEPGQAVLEKGGIKDSAAMFEAGGNLFFTYLP